ncbi:YtxH domain-containing protein [Vulgatibacter incomptus]|uniref:YtxH domain-containing protein n=1 Tax=Vulgatibacter incomptus TaxID=1391653 RepID=A0A0K1P9T7_9BACT|nr:YtxH domain-containing protein [Vulgatibacter incomptus]AKU90262.1 hypothetical protein AKJ08_0649 [Vulgatibacter incomptus]
MNWSMDSKELRKNANQLRRDVGRRFRSLPSYDLDDALELVGLRRAPRPALRFFSGLGLILGGVAVGVVAGMLLAPRRGRELRKEISQTALSGVRSGAAGPSVRMQGAHSQQ